jgi:ubiquinone/menaquinone biosynthesis C-methylase UbiE
MLGHSEHEIRRLQRQHHLFEPLTRQLFEEAGLEPGMKVLDVGSGAGDVALLLAQMVGPTGQVTGLEMNAAMLETARRRAAQVGKTNLRFIEGNLDKLELAEKFDAVVGRWILMWVADPVQVLRSLATLLNPGGLVVFQESVFFGHSAYPPSAILNEWRTIMEPMTSRQPLRQYWMGLALYQLYQAAGLPAPKMRVGTLVGTGPDWEGYQALQDAVSSLLPAIKKVNPQAAMPEVDTLAARLREETVRQQGAIMMQPLVGAWTRV